MKTIGARELNHRTAQVLEEVSASGESVAVTYRGQVRWVITPALGRVSRVEALIASGEATRPSLDLPLPPVTGRGADPVAVDRMLGALREERA